jgi:hypothetical protein
LRSGKSVVSLAFDSASRQTAYELALENGEENAEMSGFKILITFLVCFAKS